MAYQRRPTPILILIFVVLTVLVVMKCEARSLDWKKNDGRLLLRELGNTNLELHNYLRDNVINPVRESPGGPDPHHHVSEPAKTP